MARSCPDRKEDVGSVPAVVWTCAARRIWCQEQPSNSTLKANCEEDQRGGGVDAITEDMRTVDLAPENTQNRSIWRRQSHAADPVLGRR